LKTVKYLISFCILFAGVLIIGESHTFRLNNFYTEFDNTTLYLQRNTTEQEMIKDILESAARNEVEVFTYIKSPRSTYLTEIEIYGTARVEKYMNEHLNIFAKEYPSVFLEDFRFAFHHLNDIQGIKSMNDYYVIGSNEKVKQFKIDLIDKYAGNHPKEGYASNESRNTIIAIWALILSIILLLSYYDVIYQKKENLIRVSLGEPISRIVWKNIVTDTLYFTLLFALILYGLSKYTYVFFGFQLSLIFFFILLIANALLYINLYHYNLKEVFSNVKGGSKKLLSLNYGLKLVTVVITIFVISSNVVLMVESYQLYRQKSFFVDHKDYSFTRLEYRVIDYGKGSYDLRTEDAERAQAAFYKQFFKESDAILLSGTNRLLDGKGLIANRNALAYLSREIKELKNLQLNKDIYFLLPKERSGSAVDLDELKDTVRSYEGEDFTYDYEVVYYEDNVDIVRIDEDMVYGSDLLKNPIIIYYNLPPDALEKFDKDTHYLARSTEIMYKMSDGPFNQFVRDYQLTGQIVTKTNVLDSYNKSWNIAKRILYMNFIFSLLVLFLEFIIITSIIRLEYEVNAIELSIKKILGHSILEKNRKIILMTSITTIVSIGSTVVAAILLGLDKVYYLTAAGIVILLLELFVITFYIRRIENVKVQKILKGGSV
jgi:hypothetical protein